MDLANLKDKVCNESDIFEQLLALDGKEILELGCGKANMTRLIATAGRERNITATEVDEIQHSKNILMDDLPNINFIIAGSEDIPFDDSRFDVIFMFKSLHHVPLEMMDKALEEVARVLKPDGMVYISEPIYKGDFNEVLRLFHDEKAVRAAAYSAIKKSVDQGHLKLIEEFSFNSQMVFKDFKEFETSVINVTHSDHRLSSDVHQSVKDQFQKNVESSGAKFLLPIRVDLLQK